MKKALTNDHNISLAMAVWLANDGYNAGVNPHPDHEMVSVTTLLKPTRAFILSQRVPEDQLSIDVTDLIPSRMGHAIHDSIEKAWSQGYAPAMRKLGYPEKVIENVMINPPEPREDGIDIYLEQRAYRMVDGVVISGQFDAVIDGELNDTKSTSVYGFLNDSNDWEHQMQLSIYRWLNPELITSDIAQIQYCFTDWQRMMVKQNPKYPPHRVHQKTITLLSLEETERWVKRKIAEIRANVQKKQADMIECTQYELWMSDPVHKYYSNPETAKAGGRATKNFDNYPAAAEHMRTKGKGKGTIVTVQAEPKRCGYCNAMPICEQAKRLLDTDKL